jgi:hypothetical protein
LSLAQQKYVLILVMNNFVDLKDKGKTRAATAGSGGGDGFDIDKRVNRHELKTDKMQESLNRIELMLVEMRVELKSKASSAEVAEIRGELKNKATVADVAEIKGKMSQIPNFWQQMGIGIGIIGLTFAIIRFIK